MHTIQEGYGGTSALFHGGVLGGFPQEIFAKNDTLKCNLGPFSATIV